MPVDFRPAERGDLDIADRLREADRLELRAARGPNIRRTLDQALTISLGSAWAAEIDGDVIGLFGFAPFSALSDEASPWLVGTDRLATVPGVLVREGRWYCRQALCRFSVLRNYVDARNVTSIRWLRRIGFDIGPAVEFGVERRPFHPFEMRG